MSKIVTSPIKRFPGTVTLPDPMSWDQLSRWGDFVVGLGKNSFANLLTEAEFIPAFVEKIDIENFPQHPTVDPPKHLKDFASLMSWIMNEVLIVINGDEITPFTDAEFKPG